jgi:serine/threonine protein kinase
MEGPDRVTGYEHLDNEILAGRRLHRVVGDDDYPLAVSRLFGDTEGGDYRPAGTRRENKAAADPYALLDPYRGKPLHAVVGQMMDGEQEDFEASLLAGLCWLEAAGIAHRGLSPWTVRWDTHRRQAQITDFSLSTVFGVPREAIGPPKWVGPEQRPGGKVGGVVTERDDMHAAARLIYYVRSLGGEISRLDQLGELELEYLRPLFSSPDQRLTAAELLARRGGGGNPVPRGTGSDMRLENGRKRFDSRRRDKHPDAAGLGGQSGGTSNGDARNLPAGGDGPGTPGGGIPPRDPAEPVPAPPMMPGTTQPEEPADRGKRARWRRGNRF